MDSKTEYNKAHKPGKQHTRGQFSQVIIIDNIFGFPVWEITGTVAREIDWQVTSTQGLLMCRPYFRGAYEGPPGGVQVNKG